jgi:hypothetical protein
MDSQIEVGSFVVRKPSKQCSAWNSQGLGGKPVRVIAISGSQAIAIDDKSTTRWLPEYFDLVDQAYMDVIEFELEDWIVRLNHGGFPTDWPPEELAKAWKVNSLPDGHRVGSVGIEGKAYSVVWADGWKKSLFRHATAEEYRKATEKPVEAPEEAELPAALSNKMLDHGANVISQNPLVYDEGITDGSYIKVDYNAIKMEESVPDEPLENSSIDKADVDVEALEATLGDYETRLATLESTPQAPELPPLLYDRVTGEGPYIDVTNEDDTLSKDGHRYYYKGELRYAKKHKAWKQNCHWLWPGTLTTEKPEPFEPMVAQSEADNAELKASILARDEGHKAGYEAHKRLPNEAARAGWCIATLLFSMLALVLWNIISMEEPKLEKQPVPAVETVETSVGALERLRMHD